MIVNLNRYVVNVHDKPGEGAVLMGAALFSLQSKLVDDAVRIVTYNVE